MEFISLTIDRNTPLRVNPCSLAHVKPPGEIIEYPNVSIAVSRALSNTEDEHLIIIRESHGPFGQRHPHFPKSQAPVREGGAARLLERFDSINRTPHRQPRPARKPDEGSGAGIFGWTGKPPSGSNYDGARRVGQGPGKLEGIGWR
jgi:hypothetical protein